MVFCSNPAMAKLWPSRSSIVVLVRRTIRLGSTVLATVIVLVRSSWLTSGSIFRLIRPPPSTYEQL